MSQQPSVERSWAHRAADLLVFVGLCLFILPVGLLLKLLHAAGSRYRSLRVWLILKKKSWHLSLWAGCLSCCIVDAGSNKTLLNGPC